MVYVMMGSLGKLEKCQTLGVEVLDSLPSDFLHFRVCAASNALSMKEATSEIPG